MKQNKFLLWIPVYRDMSPDISVNKKYTEIMETLRAEGHNFDVITYTTKGIFFNDTCIYQTAIKNKFLLKLFFKVFGYKKILEQLKQHQYDFIWYRFRVFTFVFWRLLKKVKKPETKIVFEFGSFPFDGEFNNLKDRLKYMIFKTFIQNRLKKYVYKIITFCGQEVIYGIPTIKLSNGINAKHIEKNALTPGFKNELNLISVSSVYYWHGLDRMIKGLSDYYRDPSNSTKVFLHIVGDGKETDNLKKLVKENHLEAYIFFHGWVFGNELNEQYHRTHIGIGTLGMHRKDLTADSSLKNREYFAKGLPVILCTPDADFPENNCNYVKYVPRNDSPIKINDIIEFYIKLRTSNNGNIATQVTGYATDHLTWGKKIDQIIKEVYG